MVATERFTLTEDHLRLLRRMYVGWSKVEFGAPEIDPKRPYGNSAVHFDIAEILGIEPCPGADDTFSEEQIDRMEGLHEETEIALQVVLRAGCFEVGEYECDRYDSNWRMVYRGFEIRENDMTPAPAWLYIHRDYDGAPDSAERRMGFCDSPAECRVEIDNRWPDEEVS